MIVAGYTTAAGNAGTEERLRRLEQAIHRIELEMNRNAILAVFDSYQATGGPVRTLDASTANASDVANVLATLIQDIRHRGTRRAP